MLALAIALTVVCIYAAIAMIRASPGLVVGALGVGLSSLGILVLYFLVKFLFKANKVDRSLLTEVRRKEVPQLFDMIDAIVKKVGTSPPKKVYLSSDVNASVFYDSSFWSMFFPIKKNLQIGLGLVNSTTISELEAILSHEFGHFSQKTMKVGSYVYQVNQLTFNLLYDNDSYENMINKWANASGYFTFFVIIASKIVDLIKWILAQMYGLVNKSYMALSREMEFHADAIAASVTGYEPLKESLLRLSLADHSFSNVLSFYEKKVTENLKTDNIFKNHEYVMKFLAEENGVNIEGRFPKVDENTLTKFNKSKLVIKDQWASHPSTEDRIKRLEATGFMMDENKSDPASVLFENIEAIQQKLTYKLFNDIDKKSEFSVISHERFKSEFISEYEDGSFPKKFNGYYDRKNPTAFETSEMMDLSGAQQFNDLFSSTKVEWVNESLALEQDIETFEQISNGLIKVKTFDFDGKKYNKKDSKTLVPKLKQELDTIYLRIKENDLQIFQYFVKQEREKELSPQLQRMYDKLFAYEREIDEKSKLYREISMALDFINVTTPFEQIRGNFAKVAGLERKLKVEIRMMLEDKKYEQVITPDIRENLDLYLSRDWTYFGYDKYNEQSLEVLFLAINNYVFLLSQGYFILKKRLLVYQEGLI